METGEAGFDPEDLTLEQKREIARAVKEKMNILARSRDILFFHDKLVNKARNLQAKYPDYEDYELYHLLIGSTVYDRPEFDFPGEDSVQKFIEAEFESLQAG